MSDEIIAAVITKEDVEGVTGDLPIFVAKDQEEKEQVALILSRTTKSMVHQLPNGVYLLIRH